MTVTKAPLPKVLDGVCVKQAVLTTIKEEVASLKQQTGAVPGLAVVLVGEDPASCVYVAMKEKACQRVGIQSFKYVMSASDTQQDLEQLIKTLNQDPAVDGILLQLPLPTGFDSEAALQLIDPHKDVDGLHPTNLGKNVIGLDAFKSCTPFGILKLMDFYNIKPEGKHIVIVGRSHLVGKPLASLLLQKAAYGNATVTVCHSRSKNLAQLTQLADILIPAIGIPHFITADMVKEGAIVIDVGINRIPDETGQGYRLVGDVMYDSVYDKAQAITPVPGGVGPLTIAMLLFNTLHSFKLKQKRVL